MKPIYLLVSIVLSCIVTYSSGQPLNDDVCNATLLTVDGSQSCGTNVGATYAPSSPVCNNGPDVWYKFTPTVNGPVQIRMTTPMSGNVLVSKISVYTVAGNCPAGPFTFTNVPFGVLNFLNVAPNTVPNAVPTAGGGGGTKMVYAGCQNANRELYSDTAYLLTDTLTAGITYYIVASGKATLDGMGGFTYDDGDFCIALQTPPPAPTSCPTLLSPIGGATAPALSTTFKWNSVPNVTLYEVFISATYTAYTKDTFMVVPGLDYGQTLNWTVYPMNQSIKKDCVSPLATFNTGPSPAQPANDACTNALELATGITYQQNNASATSASTTTDCNGNTINEFYDNIHDVWFTIKPTSDKGTITLRNVYGETRFVKVYKTAFCDIAAVPSQCFKDSTIRLTGLISGSTYLVRVFSNTPFFDDKVFLPYFSTRSGPFDITFYDGVILPVTLTRFSGERRNTQNMLQWTTVSEQNNKGFEIMRSEDGVNFTTISNIIASKSADGNSSTGYTYYFADQNANGSVYYYQLKQVDKNGQTTLFSNVVVVKNNSKRSDETLKINNVYPNPSRDIVNLNIFSPFNEKVNIVIMDAIGKAVWQNTQQVNNGNNTIQIPIYHLMPGAYMIKVTDSDGRGSAPAWLTKH